MKYFNDNKKPRYVPANWAELSLFQVVFIAFKLTGKLNWNWWLVFAPTWIFGIATIVFVIIAFLAKRTKTLVEKGKSE